MGELCLIGSLMLSGAWIVTTIERNRMNTETTKQLQDKLIDTCDAMLGLVNMSSEQLVKIVSLERELTESKSEAGKWEKLHDQDTEHLVSLQKRDNYGPTETLNQTAMRLSRELAEARKQRDMLAEACRLLMKIIGPLENPAWATDDEIDYAYNTGEKALAAVTGGEA
jgi:predicted RNase H-like nuclease (RuvC/YqgF family)